VTPYRKLGNSGLLTAPLVAGGLGFGWTADEPTSFAVLDALIAGGVTMIDTADLYFAYAPGGVGGESETIIGNWLKSRGNRDKIQIATKVGIFEINGESGLSRNVIEAAIDNSLLRLQTDYVDLYYAHCDDENTSQYETIHAFDVLKKAGKIRALGASSFTQQRLESALEIAKRENLTPYSVIQPWFNLMENEKFTEGYRKYCLAHQIGVLPFYALAEGFLTGKYRTIAEAKMSERGSFAPTRYFNRRGEAVLAALDRVAMETGAVPAQIALAWLIATPGITAPIAGANTVDEAEIMISAMHLSLSEDHLRLLNSAATTSIAM